MQEENKINLILFLSRLNCKESFITYMDISFQCMVWELLAAHNVREAGWLTRKLEFTT